MSKILKVTITIEGAEDKKMNIAIPQATKNPQTNEVVPVDERMFTAQIMDNIMQSGATTLDEQQKKFIHYPPHRIMLIEAEIEEKIDLATPADMQKAIATADKVKGILS